MKRNQWVTKIVIIGLLGMIALPCSPAWSAKVLSVVQLSSDEIKDLTHMREEEKLARDVYQKMIEKWGSKIFINIHESEQTHMDQIKVLLTKYGVTDPVSSEAVGDFSDPKIDNLFDQLVNQGERSIPDALSVGVTIEELDIGDLTAALKRTERQDIANVYNKLREASRNHLESYETALDLLGYDIQP